MKKELIYAFIIGIILGISIGYFIFTSSHNSKLKICPDEWYNNQMPTDNQNNNLPSEYFIINNKRVEIAGFDIDWIKENCDINKPQIVR